MATLSQNLKLRKPVLFHEFFIIDKICERFHTVVTDCLQSTFLHM